ncbi:VanZ family protein [Adhaeribacter rhizoryzae]|uniref:VanZ family protein n=1 Tax=Adhaeribacter rhizoryzae TaxID=2607907 RepID=A0A5M6D038_9BACT|nr:VanZ family protein [Adhaeribacter rhizoryzae]KAA5540824.1 VanZ family protein [Adhaeribacter rhizoryzae]
MEEQSKIYKVTNRFTAVLFIIYLIVLSWILLLKLGVRFSYMENRSVNLIPFGESVISNGKIDVSEIILNVVIFVPLGIYIGLLFDKWVFVKHLLMIFLISALIEGLQYILAIGAFDITDIITNASGGIIGLMIFKATKKAFGNRTKAQRFINLVAAIGTGLIILLLLLLKLEMLPVRYK